jgi:YYY domain-containing protein
MYSSDFPERSPDDELRPDVPESDAEEPVADGTWPGAPVEEGEAAPSPEESAPGLPLWRALFRFGPVDVLFYALLLVILLMAAWLRFDHMNWDDFTHLHPDERFLTDMVSRLGGPLRFSDKTTEQLDAHRSLCDARYPAPANADAIQALTGAGRGGYFDAQCSPLNVNNLGQSVYVYGEFPLFTVRAAAVGRVRLSEDYYSFLETFDAGAASQHPPTTYWTSYSYAQLVGRGVSAVADLLTVLVVFLLGRRLYNRWVGLLAMAFYALAGFAIQQSHFWTVDAFTTFWVALALYFAVRALDGAGTQQGPRALVYLAIWAGGVTWEAGYQNYPVLGLVTLGAIFVVVLAVLAAVRLVLRAMRRSSGDLLVGASGVAASAIYTLAWGVLAIAAPRDFPLRNGLLSLGLVSLAFSLAVLIAYAAAGMVRRHVLGLESGGRYTLAIGAVAVMWTALMFGVLVGGLSPWATLLVALAPVALLVCDSTDLTDYVLFGAALGGAVASRINVAPLAGIIVLAAAIRALPALDVMLHRVPRSRLIAYAATGVVAAALVSFIVFRILQPHAFLGPGFFGLKINPMWRENMAEAAYYTSGNWDAPPNHQWEGRIPYLFPWRNIVEWGLGIPLGLAAWAAWLWAGIAILRGRSNWTRHAIPFAWVLVCFGWLGGRWVTTMRYFLPIYPALALFGAWGLWALVVEARKRVSLTPVPPLHAWRGGEYCSDRAACQSVPPLHAWRGGEYTLPGWMRGRGVRRLAYVGAVLLLVVVLGYTTVYGFAVHNIQRHQLSRVAASRWFQEFVPGDFGIWVEAPDGTRKMVNIGSGPVALVPAVFHLEQGNSVELTFNVPGDATLTHVIFNRLGDPESDTGIEVVRARLFRDDPSLGRQLMYEGTLQTDLSQSTSPYGSSYSLTPDQPILLKMLADSSQSPLTYILEVTAVDGGPIMAVHNVTDAEGSAPNDISVGLQMAADRTLTFVDLNFPAQPLIQGYGDDIPSPPTHWTVGGSDPVPFTAPIAGEIREIDIPHLGDPLRHVGEESVKLTLVVADGTKTSVRLTGDFNQGADPLGPPQTVIFDPPLQVQKGQMVTLVVEAQDPIYTSGPIIAWEGDWDDPVPWAVCPLPDGTIYRDDLSSGLSQPGCASVDMYAAHYKSLKLWMVSEDNDQKYQAMTNALDQADYIVISSNRFYDSLTRLPMRWPMTKAYYQALFDGQLGFDLYRTFETYPKLGPFGIHDQILPPRIPPDLLNEYWESEEAFSVYDHPTVLVYRKTPAYTPENLRAVLDSVSLRSVKTAIPGYTADPQPIGVVPWGAKEASKAPTLLEFTAKDWKIQLDGGTWRKLFDLGSIINRSQVIAVIAWWLLIVIAGWMVWPLLFAIFPALPDRAFPAAKITAWLIVAWVAWIGGTLHILAWSRLGILLILLALGVFSAALIWRRDEFWRYIRANWRHLLAMEGLALALFVAFLGVRQGNPDLWHSSFGGEKPMDFAYFNGVLRSTIFPPLDPWFAGGYINYYYFGYVIVGAPVKLLGIQPSLAYNLIIPALYSMTGIGVFSIAYNWVRSRRVPPGTLEGATTDLLPETLTPGPSPIGRGEDPHPPTPSPYGEGEPGTRDGVSLTATPDPAEPDARQRRWLEPRLPSGSAWLAGFLALLLAVVLGNLGELHVIVTSVASMPGSNSEPRWTAPLLYHQVLLKDAEARRDQIYQGFYSDEIQKFREQHGRDPSQPGEMADVSQAAQNDTNQYIHDYAYHPPLYKLWNYELGNLRTEMSAFVKGLGDVMRGKPLPIATNRWYWAPTRIIGELPEGAGGNAIAEMPYFTFLYGDLHAHMLAFPITLLVILWVLAEIMGAGYRLRRWWEAGLSLALGGVAVGVLRPTNSWDWITYLILGVAGLTYAAWVGAVRSNRDRPPSEGAQRVWRWLSPGHIRDWWVILLAVPLMLAVRVAWYVFQKAQAEQQALTGLAPGESWIHPSFTVSSALIWAAAGLVLAGVGYVVLLIALRAHIDKHLTLAWMGRLALFVAVTYIAALPFTMYFATAYNSVKLWKQDTTPLWAYMYIHGTFIFIVVSFLVWQTARWLRSVTVRDLEGMIVPVAVVGLGLIVVVLGGIVYGVRTAPVAEVTVPLIAWAALLFFLPGQNPLLRAVYVLIMLALAISLGVEIVVLTGDIGRQNTVFKFYLQVWFMLSIVGGVTLAWMLRSSSRWSGVLRGLWHGGLAVLFTIALLYPILATQARFLDRFAKDQTPITLDGMDYMKYAIQGESGLWFPLRGDYDMIRWLQDNVDGTPVIMEAHTYPSEYHWDGRISIYTGLPTILGWRFHQLQQHTLPDMDMLVQTRENNVAAFYQMGGMEGISAAMNLIHTYHIEYIVVGALERAFYDDISVDPVTNLQTAGHAPGLQKFDEMVNMSLLEVAYQAPRCLNSAITKIEECPPEQVYTDKIYHVLPGATLSEQVAAGQ